MNNQYSDFSKKIHNKSSQIAHDLLTMLLEDKETFVPQYLENPEQKAELSEKTLDVANKVLKYMATQDIPARYATMSIDKIIDALTGLKSFVDGSLNMYEDEYLSRMYGVKDEKGKYRRDMASMATLVSKLEEARQSTGNNRADFFNETAPEPVAKPEELVESPYVPENPGDKLA